MLDLVHPVSTLLFLVGYGLVLPIAVRRTKVPEKFLNAAFAGHQFGLFVAACGWVLSGRLWIAVAHLGWAVAARIWFQNRG